MNLDLSHVLHEGATRAPGVPAPEIEISGWPLPCPPGPLGQPAVAITTSRLPAHFGTHVDAQNHLFDGGKPMEAYEIDRFVGPAAFVDLRHVENREITVADLEESSLAHTGESIVFLVFGRSKFFGVDTDRYLDQPWFSVDAAQWLVDRGTTLLGMDLLTPDLPAAQRPEGFDFPIHRALLGADVLVLENAGGAIEQCLGRQAEVVCAPLRVKGADGGHVRPFARLL